MGKKVLLGMSGGVDSSVSAILLQKQGYEVIGCTMQLWREKNSEEASMVSEAKKVCETLGISHKICDCQEIFKKKVVDNFIEEYKQAKTPNPCVECNHYLKFGVFYQKAKELNCDYIATGHYARIDYSDKYNQYVLKKAKEEKKDQSYFLYTIPKEALEHIIFPLQNYTNKEEIRKIAKENELAVAKKKDSQEICFIPNDNYQEFLKTYGKIENIPGNIVLQDGTILGKHQGLSNYTIGQRKGIGISYQEPLYVIALQKETNEVIVGVQEQLYKKELCAKDVEWMVEAKYDHTIECMAKIRYRAKEAKAKVYFCEGKKEVKVIFEEPQRAITKGQSIVFYDQEGIVLGGGKII